MQRRRQERNPPTESRSTLKLAIDKETGQKTYVLAEQRPRPVARVPALFQAPDPDKASLYASYIEADTGFVCFDYAHLEGFELEDARESEAATSEERISDFACVTYDDASSFRLHATAIGGVREKERLKNLYESKTPYLTHQQMVAMTLHQNMMLDTLAHGYVRQMQGNIADLQNETNSARRAGLLGEISNQAIDQMLVSLMNFLEGMRGFHHDRTGIKEVGKDTTAFETFRTNHPHEAQILVLARMYFFTQLVAPSVTGVIERLKRMVGSGPRLTYDNQDAVNRQLSLRLTRIISDGAVTGAMASVLDDASKGLIMGDDGGAGYDARALALHELTELYGDMVKVYVPQVAEGLREALKQGHTQLPPIVETFRRHESLILLTGAGLMQYFDFSMMHALMFSTQNMGGPLASGIVLIPLLLNLLRDQGRVTLPFSVRSILPVPADNDQIVSFGRISSVFSLYMAAHLYTPALRVYTGVQLKVGFTALEWAGSGAYYVLTSFPGMAGAMGITGLASAAVAITAYPGLLSAAASLAGYFSGGFAVASAKTVMKQTWGLIRDYPALMAMGVTLLSPATQTTYEALERMGLSVPAGLAGTLGMLEKLAIFPGTAETVNETFYSGLMSPARVMDLTLSMLVLRYGVNVMVEAGMDLYELLRNPEVRARTVPPRDEIVKRALDFVTGHGLGLALGFYSLLRLRASQPYMFTAEQSPYATGSEAAAVPEYMRHMILSEFDAQTVVATNPEFYRYMMGLISALMMLSPNKYLNAIGHFDPAVVEKGLVAKLVDLSLATGFAAAGVLTSRPAKAVSRPFMEVYRWIERNTLAPIIRGTTGIDIDKSADRRLNAFVTESALESAARSLSILPAASLPPGETFLERAVGEVTGAASLPALRAALLRRNADAFIAAVMELLFMEPVRVSRFWPQPSVDFNKRLDRLEILSSELVADLLDAVRQGMDLVRKNIHSRMAREEYSEMAVELIAPEIAYLRARTEREFEVRLSDYYHDVYYRRDVFFADLWLDASLNLRRDARWPEYMALGLRQMLMQRRTVEVFFKTVVNVGVSVGLVGLTDRGGDINSIITGLGEGNAVRLVHTLVDCVRLSALFVLNARRLRNMTRLNMVSKVYAGARPYSAQFFNLGWKVGMAAMLTKMAGTEPVLGLENITMQSVVTEAAVMLAIETMITPGVVKSGYASLSHLMARMGRGMRLLSPIGTEAVQLAVERERVRLDREIDEETFDPANPKDVALYRAYLERQEPELLKKEVAGREMEDVWSDFAQFFSELEPSVQEGIEDRVIAIKARARRRAEARGRWGRIARTAILAAGALAVVRNFGEVPSLGLVPSSSSGGFGLPWNTLPSDNRTVESLYYPVSLGIGEGFGEPSELFKRLTAPTNFVENATLVNVTDAVAELVESANVNKLTPVVKTRYATHNVERYYTASQLPSAWVYLDRTFFAIDLTDPGKWIEMTAELARRAFAMGIPSDFMSILRDRPPSMSINEMFQRMANAIVDYHLIVAKIDLGDRPIFAPWLPNVPFNMWSRVQFALKGVLDPRVVGMSATDNASTQAMARLLDLYRAIEKAMKHTSTARLACNDLNDVSAQLFCPLNTNSPDAVINMAVTQRVVNALETMDPVFTNSLLKLVSTAASEFLTERPGVEGEGLDIQEEQDLERVSRLKTLPDTEDAQFKRDVLTMVLINFPEIARLNVADATEVPDMLLGDPGTRRLFLQRLLLMPSQDDFIRTAWYTAIRTKNDPASGWARLHVENEDLLGLYSSTMTALKSIAAASGKDIKDVIKVIREAGQAALVTGAAGPGTDIAIVNEIASKIDVNALAETLHIADPRQVAAFHTLCAGLLHCIDKGAAEIADEIATKRTKHDASVKLVFDRQPTLSAPGPRTEPPPQVWQLNAGDTDFATVIPQNQGSDVTALSVVVEDTLRQPSTVTGYDQLMRAVFPSVTPPLLGSGNENPVRDTYESPYPTVYNMTTAPTPVPPASLEQAQSDIMGVSFPTGLGTKNYPLHQCLINHVEDLVVLYRQRSQNLPCEAFLELLGQAKAGGLPWDDISATLALHSQGSPFTDLFFLPLRSMIQGLSFNEYMDWESTATMFAGYDDFVTATGGLFGGTLAPDDTEGLFLLRFLESEPSHAGLTYINQILYLQRFDRATFARMTDRQRLEVTRQQLHRLIDAYRVGQAYQNAQQTLTVIELADPTGNNIFIANPYRLPSGDEWKRAHDELGGVKTPPPKESIMGTVAIIAAHVLTMGATFIFGMPILGAKMEDQLFIRVDPYAYASTRSSPLAVAFGPDGYGAHLTAVEAFKDEWKGMVMAFHAGRSGHMRRLISQVRETVGLQDPLMLAYFYLSELYVGPEALDGAVSISGLMGEDACYFVRRILRSVYKEERIDLIENPVFRDIIANLYALGDERADLVKRHGGADPQYIEWMCWFVDPVRAYLLGRTDFLVINSPDTLSGGYLDFGGTVVDMGDGVVLGQTNYNDYLWLEYVTGTMLERMARNAVTRQTMRWQAALAVRNGTWD